MPEPNEQKPDPQIIITLKYGDIDVNGNCLSNLPIAMFMLEMGRDIIKANGISKALQQKDAGIVQAKGNFRSFINRIRR